MANYAELGKIVKQKYPQYASIDDAMLGEKVATKYPEYAKQFGGTSSATNYSPKFATNKPVVNTPTPTPTVTPPTPKPTVQPPVTPAVKPPTAFNQLQDFNKSLGQPTAEEQVRKEGGNWLQKTGNFLTENAPTVGALTLGAVGGLAAGPAGSIPMSGLGAAAGEAVKRKIKGEQLTKEGLKREAAGGVMGEAIGLGVGKIAGSIAKEAGMAATKKFGQITNSQSVKVLQEHGKNIIEMMNKYIPKGVSVDDVVGAEGKGKGGMFNKLLTEAENKIQSVARAVKGKIPIDVLSKLEEQKQLLSSQIGNSKRIEEINKVIAEVSKKYKKGIDLSSALKTLRAGNEAFGKNVLDVDTADAVATAAQKIETNAVREALKLRFPAIADALETQSDILTLQPLISSAKGKADVKTAWDLVKGLSLHPASWVENVPDISKKILGTPDMTSKLMGTQGGIVPDVLKGAAKAGVQSVVQPVSGGLPEKPLLTTSGASPTATPTPTTAPKSETPPMTVEQAETDYQNNIMELQSDMQALRESGEDEKTIKELETKFMKMAEDMRDSNLNIIKSTTGKQLSSTAAMAKSRNETALRDIPKLEQEIKNNPNVLLLAAIPGSIGAKYYRAKYGSILDAIGTNRTGAAYTTAQRGDYESMLPSATDSPEQVAKKIQDLKLEIETFLKNLGNTNPNELTPQSALPTKPSLSMNMGLSQTPGKYPQKWQYS